jgi:hypothetical protein
LEARLMKEMDRQVDPARRVIVDSVLKSSCPRCRGAFRKFDGRMALTCSGSGCGAAICAICQAECDKDANTHVATCKYNTLPGKVLCNVQDFNKMKKVWRIAKIREVCAENQLPGSV